MNAEAKFSLSTIGLLFLCMANSQLRAAPEAGPNDLLRFLDGAAMHGALVEIDPAKGLLWQHRDADNPFELQPAHLDYLRFTTSEQAGEAPRCHFRFYCGDELYGTLLSMNDETVEFSTWFGSTLKIQRSAVQSISFLPNNYKLLYDGPSDNDGWVLNGQPEQSTIARQINFLNPPAAGVAQVRQPANPAAPIAPAAQGAQAVLQDLFGGAGQNQVMAQAEAKARAEAQAKAEAMRLAAGQKLDVDRAKVEDDPRAKAQADAQAKAKADAEAKAVAAAAQARAQALAQLQAVQVAQAAQGVQFVQNAQGQIILQPGGAGNVIIVNGGGRLIVGGVSYGGSAGPSTNWAFKDGSLVSSGTGYMAHEFHLSRSATIEFEAECHGNFNLLLQLYASSLDRMQLSAGSYLIDFDNNPNVAPRNRSGSMSTDLGNVLLPGLFKTGHTRITLVCNQEESSITALVDGEVARHWTNVDLYSTQGGGLLFSSQSMDMMKLSHIKVSSWEGANEPDLSSIYTTNADQVSFVNHDKAAGAIVGFGQDKLSMKVGGNVLSIPEQRVRQLAFAPTDPATAAPPSGPWGVRAIFAGGGSVSFQLEKWDSDGVAGRSAIFGEVKFPTRAIREVDFNLNRPATETVPVPENEFDSLDQSNADLRPHSAISELSLIDHEQGGEVHLWVTDEEGDVALPHQAFFPNVLAQ